jgi:hypothetical protein
LAADNPMTVRQVFYQLVSQGVIAKTEAEYKSTVVRLLAAMRRAGEIPFDWIADNTRWMRKPKTYSDVEQALQRTAEAYRRSLWDNQDVYVEIWLEKDALAGVLYRVTSSWDVPLMVTRGYPSLSYLYEAADTIAAVGKPAHLYYFGDNDPSGLDITRAVEAEVYFERVAVTAAQITDLGLPTRPTKKTDSRSKGFEGALHIFGVLHIYSAGCTFIRPVVAFDVLFQEVALILRPAGLLLGSAQSVVSPAGVHWQRRRAV